MRGKRPYHFERERTQKAPRSFHNGRRGYHFF
nr:MAG TPA: hypothetical protein [Caudoviricetes sp.]